MSASSKAADRVKILTFEGDGLVIWYKRLERGTFRFPTSVDDSGKVAIRGSSVWFGSV